VSRQYLNLTAGAWRQLRRNWRLPASPIQPWQTIGPGSVFSILAGMQETVPRDQLAKANLRDAVVVLGYWRSGTTLQHELLCLDTRYTYPTTRACMNPHHFLFSEASSLSKARALHALWIRWRSGPIRHKKTSSRCHRWVRARLTKRFLYPESCRKR